MTAADLTRTPEAMTEALQADMLALGRAAREAATLLALTPAEAKNAALMAAAAALRELGSPGIILLRRSAGDADRPGAQLARQILDLPREPRWRREVA